MTEGPISLYFDLPKGEHADLETVARATLEWIEAIRDIASVVAPDVEYEIEFVSSEEGSLWLTNLIKAVREGDRKALASIVAAVVVFFGMGPALHMQTDLGDAFWERLGHEHDVTITDADKAEIAQKVVEAIETTQAEDRRAALVREVERDPRIRGVGVGLAPSEGGPDARIPRAAFHEYRSAIEPQREPIRKDTEIQHGIRVKIIRASLEEGDAKPRWRFAEGDVKWSAAIEDEEFIFALNAERTGLPLAAGQTMIVDVAIDRTQIDGAWKEANRRIVFVREPAINRRQQSLWPRGQHLDGHVAQKD